MSDFFKKTISDIRTELSEEFDRNFERKAFFTERWTPRKREGRGSLMIASGRLRRSYRSVIRGGAITFSSDAPYASIHNKGGRVPITPKMRKFFWAMYYKNMQGVSFSIKSQKTTSQRSDTKNNTALYWRGMAMHKAAHITMPKRQTIGAHAKVDEAINRCVERQAKELTKELDQFFKRI